MVRITIKNKCYHGITTMLDGRTFRIPSKGKDSTLWVTKVTDHLKYLESTNKIKVIVHEEK